MELDLVGIGHPCMDMISVVDRIPGPDQSTRVREVSRQGGGVVPTAVVAAARLGTRAGFVGVSGGCMHGQAIREDFQRHGVDLSHAPVDHEGYSDFAMIVSDLETRGRSILYHPGTVRRLRVSDLDRDYVTSARMLHLAASGEVEQQAARWMRDAGGTVVYDGTSVLPELPELLPWIDVLIVSEYFYRERFCDDAYENNCRELQRMGPGIVVVTLGKKGCVGVGPEGAFSVPVFDTPVKDTLGAGDVFHGAFIHGLLRGWPTPDIARFANAVSSIKVTAIGGRAGIPNPETVSHFLRTGEIDSTEIEERVRMYRDLWLFGSFRKPD
jgi:sulfofructose kinase